MSRDDRKLLGHLLTFGEPYTRQVDTARGREEATTERVSCSHCGGEWDGVGFVLTRCIGFVATRATGVVS